jgi:hypothetical protein
MKKMNLWKSFGSEKEWKFVGRSCYGTSVAVDGKIETCWRVPY